METRYGRFYKTRDGRKVGPIKKSPYGIVWLTADGFEGDQWYSSIHKKGGFEGRCYSDREDPLDLVEEWFDKPANRFYGEQRKPPKLGYHGYAHLDYNPEAGWMVHVDENNYRPDELREIAHFLNQLAEYLENNN